MLHKCAVQSYRLDHYVPISKFLFFFCEAKKTGENDTSCLVKKYVKHFCHYLWHPVFILINPDACLAVPFQGKWKLSLLSINKNSWMTSTIILLYGIPSYPSFEKKIRVSSVWIRWKWTGNTLCAAIRKLGSVLDLWLGLLILHPGDIWSL